MDVYYIRLSLAEIKLDLLFLLIRQRPVDLMKSSIRENN